MGINVLFLCGVFSEENLQEVIKSAQGTVEHSANIFQEKLISGFRNVGIKLEVLSAPFIGAFPMRSKTIFFKGFKNTTSDYKYVSFNNIWGYRNLSRADSLKKSIKVFAKKKTTDKKIIVVYSAHEPFLEAAAFAKKIDSTIKICYVVPDLPQYMNLDANRSFVYDVFKKIDIKRMNKYLDYVDSFVVLTEQMKKILPIGKRPSIVVEGIVEDFSNNDLSIEKKDVDEKLIVYTGKLNVKFGVKDLVDAFMSIDKKEYRLVLCGNGDCDSYIKNAALRDKRIMYIGQVHPREARMWQKKAELLINPRPNNEEYTKYSFPSKNIEYLLTGKPVVAYLLDGMSEIYRDFLFVIDENNIVEAIEKAMYASDTEKEGKYHDFIHYARSRLNAGYIAKEIIKMCI